MAIYEEEIPDPGDVNPGDEIIIGEDAIIWLAGEDAEAFILRAAEIGCTIAAIGDQITFVEKDAPSSSLVYQMENDAKISDLTARIEALEP